MAKLLIKHHSNQTKDNIISIVLDGEHIGDIKNGVSLEFPLVAGKRLIYAKIGSKQSDIISFDIEDREQVQFSVWADGGFIKKPIIKKDFQTKLKKRFLAYASHESPHSTDCANDTSLSLKKIDCESILGVKSSSSNAELRMAFIRLMKQFHPDKTIYLSEDEKKIKNFKAAEITMAYAYLKNIRKI